jgi:copper homeostasis protein
VSADARRVLVEACVETVDGARAAEAAGAGRVELCAGLIEGGTTPSGGAIAVARERIAIPLFVIVRPRAGDFIYSDDDLAVMRHDIASAASAGADGVVIGALTCAGRVDGAIVRELVDRARPMHVTFHRAFDLTPDLAESLEMLADAGVDRVLTSGGAPTAAEGTATLASLVRQAGDRIVILAGGGITESNAARIIRETGVREIHLRGERTVSVMRNFQARGAESA